MGQALGAGATLAFGKLGVLGLSKGMAEADVPMHLKASRPEYVIKS